MDGATSLCCKNFLLAELERKIVDFGKEADKHRNLYRRLRYWTFSLTFCSGLLAACGLYMGDASGQKNINLLVEAIALGIAFVTSLEGLRKPAELWILERTTYYALMDLKREVEFVCCQNGEVDLYPYFVKLQEILGAAGSKWNKNVAGVQAPPNPVAVGLPPNPTGTTGAAGQVDAVG